ncbi:30S ribosomal protein S15 [candidate division WOR-3 bacterium]|nr:30S ribosomal protein S15 [candidate division WOR-3 bacterium]MCK4528651.1 30S ribosomal protein S15 [candidate division WOR-3 bacterium]
MKISGKSTAEIMKKFGRNDKDTGSPEVQIALLTARIEQLTEHLKKEKKDYHSRKGLELMVSQRKRLLKYLRRKEPDSFKKVTKTLGLRV